MVKWRLDIIYWMLQLIGAVDIITSIQELVHEEGIVYSIMHIMKMILILLSN